MFRLAIDWEMLEKNPAMRVPQFREDNKRERYLSEDELGQLLSVLESHSKRTIALLILWQLSTGARINESLRAKREDINEKTLQWRIPVSNSKSKRARTVPLNQTAMDVLEQLERFDGVPHLFVNPRTKIATSTSIKPGGISELRPGYRICNCMTCGTSLRQCW